MFYSSVFNIRLVYPRVSIFFLFFFLIDNWPRAFGSHSHALTALSFSLNLLYKVLNRFHTRKKRRRRTAYGRNLYKINNDTFNQSRGLWC